MTTFTSYKKLLQRVFEFSSVAPVISLILQLVNGLVQGIGIMMLIPFLELAGVSAGESQSSIAIQIEHFFTQFKIPFNLLTALLVYVILITFVGALRYLKNVHDSKLVQDFTKYLRCEIHTVFSQAGWSIKIRNESAEIGNIFVTEIQRVGYAIKQSIQSIGMLVMMAIYIGVSFLLSVPMSLLVLIGMGILLLLHKPINSIVYNTGITSHNDLRDFHQSIHEHIEGFKDVKSIDREGAYHDHFRDIISSIRDVYHRFGIARARSKFMFEVLSVVMIAAIFYISLNFFQIQIAELLVLLYIFSRLTPQFHSLLRSYQKILNILPAFEAIQDFYEECLRYREIDDDVRLIQPDAWTPIYFRQVSYCYPSLKEPVLDQLSFTIQPNQLTVIYGPSGAGKSTIADMLLQLITPTTGTISIGEIKLTDISHASWRTGIGYVPQAPFLFNSSIRENLLWAKPDSTEVELWNALQLIGARSFISGLPQGLETQVGDNGFKFSGGERQLIALARALVRAPRLLILDEVIDDIYNSTVTTIRIPH